jgi:hypothetical protein
VQQEPFLTLLNKFFLMVHLIMEMLINIIQERKNKKGAEEAIKIQANQSGTLKGVFAIY